ncbi:hypothetical protein [Gottfriedia acidiceleris]|uniref:hypothetical protein n=1 Tax=Gottfriedia acidiceleris TaxID=371036 RepID=UPI003D25048C
MITVLFEYKFEKKFLEDFKSRLKKSAHPKFHSEPSNIGMNFMQREDEQYYYINLFIKYRSKEEYEERTRFERSQVEWNETWFSKDITHELLSVTIWKDFSPMS